uniref:rRNA-processing protein FYV7 n=1 Tax=Panagrolaimus sp. JU765 TaxID=591449 RepID=A0AC34QLJ1_9BILA
MDDSKASASKPISKTQQKKEEHFKRRQMGRERDGMPRMSEYQRAKLQYEKIQKERKEAYENKRAQMERREKERESALGLRKKKDLAIKKRTKKGQPNFNAVVGCIVEKLMRDKERNKD